MTKTLIRSTILATVIFAAAVLCFGQEPKGKMLAGEKLVFEGKISRYKVGISIAELTFAASLQPSSNNLIVKTEAVSKGTLLKLFRYSFLQQYESTIDLENFRILKTTKHDVQKDRVRDSEAVFNYTTKRVNYVETDPKDKNRPPRMIASEITSPMYDIISAIYSVRLAPLSVGKRLELQVSDSGLVYKVPIVVTGTEQLTSELGKYKCYRVEPDVFGPGRLIEQKGKMVIWMADNGRLTPVKAQLDTTYGKIEIKLKSFVNPS